MFACLRMKPPYFLNVDLDIESKSSLRSLVRELGKRVTVMFSGRMNGRYCLFVESAGSERHQDATIKALCALIEGLSPSSRQLWDAAHRKEFDLGYESRFSSQRANRFRILPDTLRRVAELRASVAVTLYSERRGEANKTVQRTGASRFAQKPNRTLGTAGSRR